jgi:hypothetical protein
MQTLCNVHLIKKAMKQILFIASFLISQNCFSQNLQDSLIKNYAADTSKPTLYCGSGYETLAYSEADKSFEKQYKVKYTIVGCIQIYSVEGMSFHNKAIAQFFDRKFGLKWRDALRSDVLGVTN